MVTSSADPRCVVNKTDSQRREVTHAEIQSPIPCPAQSSGGGQGPASAAGRSLNPKPPSSRGGWILSEADMQLQALPGQEQPVLSIKRSQFPWIKQEEERESQRTS